MRIILYIYSTLDIHSSLHYQFLTRSSRFQDRASTMYETKCNFKEITAIWDTKSQQESLKPLWSGLQMLPSMLPVASPHSLLKTLSIKPVLLLRTSQVCFPWDLLLGAFPSLLSKHKSFELYAIFSLQEGTMKIVVHNRLKGRTTSTQCEFACIW